MKLLEGREEGGGARGEGGGGRGEGGERKGGEREGRTKGLAQWSELDRYSLTLEDPQRSANPDINGSPSCSTACSMSHRYLVHVVVAKGLSP